MAKLLKLRRGTTTQHSSFTGAEGEVTIDTTKDTAVVHDGSQAGGRPLAREDLNNVSAASVRSLVESASDSNVFTDADHTKLNGIEASATADQTASEIVALVAGQAIAPSTVYATSNIGKDAGDFISFTTDTQMDITINGNNEFRFEADGDFHADGDVIAQSTTISSDRRLKENIERVPNALDKIEALNGVTFDWKKTGEKSAGVIAQEVQEVLPEAVKEVTALGNGETHLTVNYHALTSILIEAIKELKAEIDIHKASCCEGGK